MIPYCTGQRRKARRGGVPQPDHTAGEQQSWDLNLGRRAQTLLQASARRDCITQGVLRDVLSHHYMITSAQRPEVSMPQLGLTVLGSGHSLLVPAGAAGQAAGSGRGL